MPTVYDVDPNELISRAKEKLKEFDKISPPDWAKFVKTGIHKERPPEQEDWWYIRAAAILRTLYIHGPLGISRLRKKYGGRKRHTNAPERKVRGSGSIIRKILQQLEEIGFVRKISEGRKKGREITKEGKSFLDKIASEIWREKYGNR